MLNEFMLLVSHFFIVKFLKRALTLIRIFWEFSELFGFFPHFLESNLKLLNIFS